MEVLSVVGAVLEIGLSAANVQTILAQTDPQVLALIALVAGQVSKRRGRGRGRGHHTLADHRCLPVELGHDDLAAILAFVFIALLFFFVFFLLVAWLVLVARIVLPALLQGDESARVQVFDEQVADEYDVRTSAREGDLLLGAVPVTTVTLLLLMMMIMAVVVIIMTVVAKL